MFSFLFQYTIHFTPIYEHHKEWDSEDSKYYET